MEVMSPLQQITLCGIENLTNQCTRLDLSFPFLETFYGVMQTDNAILFNLKGIVYPQIKILPRVIPNLYTFRKRRYFEVGNQTIQLTTDFHCMDRKTNKQTETSQNTFLCFIKERSQIHLERHEGEQMMTHFFKMCLDVIKIFGEWAYFHT